MINNICVSVVSPSASAPHFTWWHTPYHMLHQHIHALSLSLSQVISHHNNTHSITVFTNRNKTNNHNLQLVRLNNNAINMFVFYGVVLISIQVFSYTIYYWWFIYFCSFLNKYYKGNIVEWKKGEDITRKIGLIWCVQHIKLLRISIWLDLWILQ